MTKALGITLTMLGLVAACSEETIILASAPADVDAGMVTYVAWKNCYQSEECAQGYYCKKSNCRTSTPGKCTPRPIFCDDDNLEDIRVVCGCSGISYVNDCLRAQAGEESSTLHECDDDGPLRTCNDTKPCPSGAVCERIGGGKPSDVACGRDPDTQGRCWGIATCPPSKDRSWTECSTKDGALKCVDGCTAVQSGRAFTKAEPARDCPP